MTQKRTVRLILPRWQGDADADAGWSDQLLAAILPAAKQATAMTVPTTTDSGLAGQSSWAEELAAIQASLDVQRPDHLITVGGDGTLLPAPIDYLSQRYGEHLGVLWLANHPAVAKVTSTVATNAIVTNLLGQGYATMQRPLLPRQVLFAGPDPAKLRPMDQAVTTLALPVVSAEALASDSQPVLDWLAAEQIQQLVVHFDLSVLSPADFRSLTPVPGSATQPGGQLALRQVAQLLQAVSAAAEVVGFSLVAPVSQDAVQLHQTLQTLPLFDAS